MSVLVGVLLVALVAGLGQLPTSMGSRLVGGLYQVANALPSPDRVNEPDRETI